MERFFYRTNREIGWLDETGFLDDAEQANALILYLKDEFRGEVVESGVKVVSPEKNARDFVKYIRLRLNPLERGRFETALADYLGCSIDNVGNMALEC